MRICIFGAGAVGSHFAVRLAQAGHDVSCVMRGPHLQAVKTDGLILRVGKSEVTAGINASDDPAALGPQDVVISTLKATGVAGLASGLKPLLRDDTPVVFAQNGIPWWYDIGLPAAHPPTPDLAFLDPGGRLRAAVPKERIIGGVIFSSNEVIKPGLVEIRETIWSKLLTNMSMSVLCLMTGQTARGVRDDPDLANILPRLLEEANLIGQSCIPAVKRVTRTGPAPEHKPSILQDYELGRAMEIDVLVRAPAAFARAANLSTPMLDMLAGLAIQKARGKGLYSG
jgi:2-dehydropantoate 2-reductase